MWKNKVTITALVSCFLLFANAVLAQDEGSLSGTITDAESGDALIGANVLLEDLGVGSSTDAEGNYLIESIPAGTYVVSIEYVGYSSETTEVSIAAGEETQLDIELASDVLGLDQLLVTARGTSSARREIGTSLTSIDPAELEGGPIQSMSELLQGRAAGMNIQLGGGKVGQQHTIVMRGAASISQSNEPVIYVDGVRIDNSRSSGITTTTAGVTWSGLDDINPEDIERIEVVRGASAATLYGTEASSGVIQIFTKQGRDGAPEFTFRSRGGISHTPRSYWDVSAYSDWFYDNQVRTGGLHSQYLSVSGGFEDFRYYASGTIRNETGVVPSSAEDYGALRLNMGFDATDNLSIDLNTSYSDRSVQHVPDANNTVGLTINGLMGGPAGQFMATDDVSNVETFQEGNRFNTSLQLEHNPTDIFNHRLTFGYETTDQDQHQLFPYAGTAVWEEGYRTNYRRAVRNINFDYIATVGFTPTDWLRSNTSAGFQIYDTESGSSSVIGDGFPLIGLEVVGAAIDISGTESRFNERSAGFFIEQQFGFNERFYMTLGARADGHSAFGDDVEYQLYPKVDLSYMLSESGFWPEQIGTFRLRAAYGTAGQQPGAFTAVRTWSPTAAIDGQPAVTPGNIGNPELSPEVAHEYEAGFDASVWRDLVNVDFTYYYQRTEDALYDFRYPPSEGFTATQLENVGEIVNQGLEVSVDARILNFDNFTWEANAGFGYNENEVTDLGGAAPTTVQWRQQIREGYPVGSYFGDHLVEVDGEVGQASELLADADGNLPEGWDYLGSPIPEHTLQVGSNFTMGSNWSARFMFDYQGGHHLYSSTMRWMMNSSHAIEDGQGIAEPGPVANLCREDDDPVVQANCNRTSLLSQGDFTYPADILRLREMSITYELPTQLINQIGLNRARFTVSGRNLLRWQEYPGLEAEANYRGDLSDSAIRRQIFFDTPIPRQFLASLSVDF